MPVIPQDRPSGVLSEAAGSRVLLQLGSENMTPDLIGSGSETEGHAVLALLQFLDQLDPS